MGNRENRRLDEITVGTLIMGVDVAKTDQWVRFVDDRGREIGKAVSIRNDRRGFETIVAEIRLRRNNKLLRQPITQVIVGMEPTGHYWKPLANYLMYKGFRVVGINPFHTKKAKELDDNSPTKSDKKDALTIARLVKDGRFFDPYLPQDVYAELRGLTNARVGIIKRGNAVKNNITAILDEYFPELWTVFKKPLKSKAARQVLRACPFPTMILALGEVGVLTEIKKAVKRSPGIKRVLRLMEAARQSIGVAYGQQAAKLRLGWLLDELEQNERQLAQVEAVMQEMLETTGYAEQILSVKGIGIVTAASFLGEVGDPLRFQNARQIANYAGYNLVEDSSGKNKSGTCISKRGRSQLRSVLYLMAYTAVGTNPEMKRLYHHLTTRKVNPLKKKQALVVVSKKIITVIFTLLKKQQSYHPELVFGTARQEMLLAA